ncbi:protein TIFY 4B [Carex littledalei]|uniref:Protein TIFY n=1 Tax=Carex littledalei TaxID=544730 RepID=A0A833QIE1_9POAL|nr:protein TIFY 4B [Carex littledalei]
MNCREAAALVVNETHVAAVATHPTNARSPLEKPLTELREEDIAQVTREDCRRFLKERGMRRPSWNKSQAIQQVISLKALLEGRPGAGDPPVSSFLLPSKSPHAPTPSHDAPSSEKNETSGSGGSVPLPKEPLLSPYRRRDPVPNPPVLDPVPTPRCPPPPENRPATECAPGQLTILYDGQRNVYDGVTPDKAKAIMQLAESSENYYSVPMPTQPSRLPPPRFPASFPGPGGSMPSTPQACCILPPSPTGCAKFPRLCRESTEEPRLPRENEPEGPTTRKASLQRYLEKRKDRFKGKKILGVTPGTSMDMMYMSHKTIWCQTSNEMRPISPPIPTQCGPQPNHPTKVCLSFDLNDKADED